MSDKDTGLNDPPRVTADYVDMRGDLIWHDDPYPFKRMFAREQEVYQDFGKPNAKRFYVIGRVFDGVIDNGNITYVVTPNWSDVLKARRHK